MTDWNERYLKGETPWEKGAPAPPLLELFEKMDLGIWGGGKVLVSPKPSNHGAGGESPSRNALPRPAASKYPARPGTKPPKGRK
jgi:hypothetical protein